MHNSSWGQSLNQVWPIGMEGRSSNYFSIYSRTLLTWTKLTETPGNLNMIWFPLTPYFQSFTTYTPSNSNHFCFLWGFKVAGLYCISNGLSKLIKRIGVWVAHKLSWNSQLVAYPNRLLIPLTQLLSFPFVGKRLCNIYRILYKLSNVSYKELWYSY